MSWRVTESVSEEMAINLIKKRQGNVEELHEVNNVQEI